MTSTLRPARWVLLLLALSLGGVLSVVVRARQRQARPPRLAYWYWNHPFRLTATEEQTMREVGLDRLYVHAATLDLREGQLQAIRVQSWRSDAPVPVWGVIRVHPRAHAILLSADGAAAAALALRAAHLPSSLAGLQWDADVPTRRLSDYARFLREFRQHLPAGQELSATALPTWLESADYARVCAALDEIAPQFYGNHWPEDGRAPPPLWETDRLRQQISRAARYGTRVWVGLPAYGRCLVFDPAGQPVGVRHDLDPDMLLEDPIWSVQGSETRKARWDRDSQPVAVEEALALRAEDDALAGPIDLPAGSLLWFQWPRVSGLAEVARRVYATAPANVAGICYFRWPVEGEPLSLAPAAIGAARRGNQPSTDLRCEIEDSGRLRLLTVVNHGSDSPALEGGIEVRISPAGGVQLLSPGAFVSRRGDSFASPLRAEQMTLSRPILRPGSVWRLGVLDSSAFEVNVTLRWQDDGGEWQSRTTTFERQAE